MDCLLIATHLCYISEHPKLHTFAPLLILNLQSMNDISKFLSYGKFGVYIKELIVFYVLVIDVVCQYSVSL